MMPCAKRGGCPAQKSKIMWESSYQEKCMIAMFVNKRKLLSDQ